MKFIYGLITSLILFTCNAYCQSVSAPLYSSLTDTTHAHLTEQIFVHTDKTFYTAGEIIWFKIYCVENSSHKLLNLSKVAYVELLDSIHKPAVQAKIALEKGTGDGSFSLPFSLSSGSYKLRAYTNWMKNDGADVFFEKNITVVNTQKLTIDNRKQNNETASIHFFPEGGNWVNNIRIRIAFHATDSYGKGIHCRGVVMDGNDSLLSFTDNHSGIGSFYITTLPKHVYTVRVQAENGKSFTQILPAAQEEGFTMQATKTKDEQVTINVATNSIASQPVYLLIHQNKKLFIAKQATLQNNTAVFSVAASALPYGVSVFTIFDIQKQPVCERLFYKPYPDQSSVRVNADEKEYEARKKVTLDLLDKNMMNEDTGWANLSVSVYRIDSLQILDDQTIDAYMNLSSGLLTGVDDPQYYLHPQDENAIAATNELMLVNGWRTFNMDKTSGTTNVLSFAPEYRGHVITAKIMNNTTHLPQQNTDVYLSLPGKGKQFFTSVSDTNGNLSWETGQWYDNTKLVVQNDNKDSSYTISINDPFSHQYSSSSSAPFALPFHQPNTLLQHNISMQAENIYLNEERSRFDSVKNDSIPFFITPDKTYKLDDYSRFTTMEEVLREYIALVNVTKRKGDYHFPVYDMSGAKVFSGDPLVLVDGIPYLNLDTFIAFDPLKLKKLEVVNRRYFYGDAVFDGILNWHTYDGDASSFDIDPKTVTVNYDGLQERRRFYSPSYETEAQLSSHVPDFRNLLYWNPNILLTGKQQLSFYTSDLAGTYAAVAQGITASGEAVSAVTTFEVKK